jgi:hypothetical protein
VRIGIQSSAKYDASSFPFRKVVEEAASYQVPVAELR